MYLFCPNCQKMLQVPEQYAGQLMKCPLCADTFTVPTRPENNRPSSASAWQGGDGSTGLLWGSLLVILWLCKYVAEPLLLSLVNVVAWLCETAIPSLHREANDALAWFLQHLVAPATWASGRFLNAAWREWYFWSVEDD